jgi:non-ribosomal peptide synthetase component E (peptide arylation enzyme)
VAERISAYKVPERFIVLPNLPLNASNKIDRKKLHARVLADARAR